MHNDICKHTDRDRVHVHTVYGGCMNVEPFGYAAILALRADIGSLELAREFARIGMIKYNKLSQSAHGKTTRYRIIYTAYMGMFSIRRAPYNE